MYSDNDKIFMVLRKLCKALPYNKSHNANTKYENADIEKGEKQKLADEKIEKPSTSIINTENINNVNIENNRKALENSNDKQDNIDIGMPKKSDAMNGEQKYSTLLNILTHVLDNDCTALDTLSPNRIDESDILNSNRIDVLDILGYKRIDINNPRCVSERKIDRLKVMCETINSTDDLIQFFETLQNFVNSLNSCLSFIYGTECSPGANMPEDISELYQTFKKAIVGVLNRTPLNPVLLGFRNFESFLDGIEFFNSQPDLLFINNLEAYKSELLKSLPNLDDFIGQEHIKKAIDIHLKSNENHLRNCFFYGPSYIGKKTFVRLLANQMNCKAKFVNSSSIKNDSALLCHMLGLNDNDILCITEFNKLKKDVKEKLLECLKVHQFEFNFPCRSEPMSISNFVLIGLSSSIDKKLEWAYDCFDIKKEFKLYTPEEISLMLLKGTPYLKCEISNEGVLEISKKANGIPKNALNNLNTIVNYALSLGKNSIDLQFVKQTLDAL